MEILPLDVPADAGYGAIRAELEAVGQPICPNDLLIAAHAYVLGIPLITDNIREFTRIRGLRVENWLECAGPFSPSPQIAFDVKLKN